VRNWYASIDEDADGPILVTVWQCELFLPAIPQDCFRAWIDLFLVTEMSVQHHTRLLLLVIWCPICLEIRV
jgi:hypothetical protein